MVDEEQVLGLDLIWVDELAVLMFTILIELSIGWVDFPNLLNSMLFPPSNSLF